MNRIGLVALLVAVASLAACTAKLSTAQACSEYNALSKLMINSASDDALQKKYGSQMKDIIDKAPDTVKDDMHAIYLLMTDSPDAKRNPEAAQRIEIACKSAQ